MGKATAQDRKLAIERWVRAREALAARDSHVTLREWMRAREELVRVNQGIAHVIAHRYAAYRADNPDDENDMFQQCCLGILRAAEDYDPERGAFAPYAVAIMRGYIQRWFQKQSLIQIPAHMHEADRRIRRQVTRFLLANGYYPSDDQIAILASVPEHHVRWLRDHAIAYLSLTTPTAAHEDGTSVPLADMIPDQQCRDAIAGLQGQECVATVATALKSLTAREEQILRMRFGVDDDNEQTLEEIGERLHLTRERVRQIEANALQKLRSPWLRRLNPELARAAEE